MKKIFVTAACFALAGTIVMSGCGKKDEDKKTNVKDDKKEEVIDEIKIEIPEAQKDFELSINTFDMSATISAYTGSDAEVTVPETVVDPSFGDVVPVVAIGEYAFAENETLKAVELPSTVTEIKKGAFQSCPALEGVLLPEGLEKIEANAFYNSVSLEKLGVAAEETDGAESVLDKISDKFPETVKEIGFMAFSSQLNETPWYSSLKGNVVMIGDGILLKYKAGSLTIDESIKSVAYYAFSNVGAERITVTNPEVEFDSNAVFMCDKELTFVIPDGAKDLATAIKACGASYEFATAEKSDDESDGAEGEDGELAEGEKNEEENAENE